MRSRFGAYGALAPRKRSHWIATAGGDFRGCGIEPAGPAKRSHDQSCNCISPARGAPHVRGDGAHIPYDAEVFAPACEKRLIGHRNSSFSGSKGTGLMLSICCDAGTEIESDAR
jgi:hypothetical protein